MKITFILTFLALSVTSFAQYTGDKKKNKFKNSDFIKSSALTRAVIPYSFSIYSGTYLDLTGATSLNNGITWDDPGFSVPVGFTFNYFDTGIDSIFVNSFFLGGTLTVDTSNTGVQPVLFAFDADIIDRGSDTANYEGQAGSLSPVSYKTEGTAGSRILKIEWKNAGFFSDISDNNISIDYVNFQLWLFEGTDNIEIHFGPNSVTQPALDYDGFSGPMICLMPEFDFVTESPQSNFMLLRGNPVSPIAADTSDVAFLTGTIPDGTIYKFSRIYNGIPFSETKDSHFNIYPVPAKNFITIQNTSNTAGRYFLTVKNIQGREVLSKNIVFSNTYKLDLTGIDNGIYVLTLQNNNEMIVKKIVVQQ